MSEPFDEFHLELPPQPYPGLRPFEKNEWMIFFGRETMTQDIVRRLVAKGFVAIHGDSGCGKSSLVKAGVLPFLEREQERLGGRWRTVEMKPGDAPLGNLARALAGIDGEATRERALDIRRLLNRGAGAPAAVAEFLGCDAQHNVCIVFDQFEELFEHAKREGGPDASLITEFLVSLDATRPKGLFAILTMRSDYLGRCAQYQNFAEAVNEAQYLVPRMERAALMRAIRDPASLYRGSVSLDLAARLIADAGEGQDQLPLIQHGLMLMWRRKASGGVAANLTLDDSHASGSLAATLSAHADEVMAEAIREPGDERCVEAIFRALTGRSSEGLAIRRSRSIAELVELAGTPRATVVRIVDRFRAADASFLRPYGEQPLGDDDSIDVSHEAFIRNWTKINAPDTGWLDQEAEDRRVWSLLKNAGEDFAQDPNKLLTGPVAAAHEQWIAGRNPAWARLHGDDLEHDDSWETVSALIKASVNKARRDIFRNRAFFVGALVVAAGVALFVVGANQRLRARNAELLATQAQVQLNQSLYLSVLAKEALRGDKPDLAQGLLLRALGGTEEGDRSKAVPLATSVLNDLLRLDRRIVSLNGHESRVNAAVFSPDGARIVTASHDGTAVLWDTASGAEVRVLRGHRGAVLSAAFSPDGTRLLTADSDGAAFVWHAATGDELLRLQGHSDWIRSVAFSPDGTRAATASDDGIALVWDMADGRRVAELRGHEDWIYSVAFSPDGRHIVTASADKDAGLWDAQSGQLIGWLRHEDSVNSAVFSPDGRFIVTASGDNNAGLWDAESGALLRWLKGHTGAVRSAVFSPDGRRVLTASADKDAGLWNAESGALIRWLTHGDRVNGAVFSPDGEHVITVAEDGTARLWRMADNTQITVLSDEVQLLSAAFSPDGRRVLTATEEGTALLWDVVDKSRIVSRGHGGDVNSAFFSPDGARIVTASDDQTARVWDAATGDELLPLEGHERLLWWATFSPDGRRIVTASADKTARVWDATTGEALFSLDGHEGEVNSAVFSPDGGRIATASDDRTARVWDAASGAELHVLEGHTNWVRSVAFSPDGARIVTASDDKTARVFDAATGKELLPLAAQGSLRSAAFSPDGRRIVTASADKTARVWDAATGDELLRLEGHEREVMSAFFSPDGGRIVTGSLDSTARVWDAENGTAIETLEGHAGIWSASFSPDGKQVLAGLADDTARTWSLSSVDTSVLVQQTQAGQFRLLTAGEWARAGLPEDGAVSPIPADVHECDRLATRHFDPQAVAPGVSFSDLDAPAAISVCEAAVAAHPREPRYRFLLGRALLKDGQNEKSVEAYRKAADAGYAMAFDYLAAMYRDGYGVEKSPAEALSFYEEAMARGVYVSGFSIGTMIWDGDGTTVDRARAVEIWRKAAAMGDPSSHQKLAWVAEIGRDGTEADPALALYHYAVSVRLFEAAGAAREAEAPRYRRATLARLLDPETVAEQWRAAQQFQPAQP